MTKFQDKFTSLRQVNSPNSWEKFQICFTDMYVIRFLPNFTVFCMFLWISRLCDGAKYQKPWLRAASFTLHELATKNLHLVTIFLQLVAKRRPEDFFNFEPWYQIKLKRFMTIDKWSQILSTNCYGKVWRSVWRLCLWIVWLKEFIGMAREVEVETTGICVPCNNSRVGTWGGQCRVSSPGHVDHKINVVAS